MKAQKVHIDEFLAQKQIAVAGYSRNSKKFGNAVYKSLKDKGYELFPVNPAGGTTDDGTIIYTDVNALPEQVKALLVVTKPEASRDLVKAAIDKKFNNIWVQQLSDNAEVKEMLDNSPANHVTGQCIILHANPTGFHKVHWWIAKLFKLAPL